MLFNYQKKKLFLDYKLEPFIPDFLPAVGDIDAFIKVDMLQDKGNQFLPETLIF